MAGGKASKKKSKQAIATTTATSSTSSKQQQSKQNVPPNKPNSNDTAQNSVITPIQSTNNKNSELFAKSADASDSDEDVIGITTKSIEEARTWRPPPNNPKMGQLNYEFIGRPSEMWVNGKIVQQTDSSITVEWGLGTNISFTTSYTSLKQLLQWKDELSGVELDSKESRRRNTAIPQQEDNMKVVRKKKSNKLNVGDRVEAKFNGTGSYFPGVIKAVNSGNTYDILYDSDGDGLQQDIDKYLHGRHIRLLGKETESSDEETSSEEESDEESSDEENYKRDMKEEEDEDESSSGSDEEDNDLLDSDEEIISNEEKKKDVSKYKQSSLTETFTSNKTKTPQTKKAAPPRTKKGGEGKENDISSSATTTASKGGARKKSPSSSNDTMMESEEESGADGNTMKKASKLSKAAPSKAAAKSSTKHSADNNEMIQPPGKRPKKAAATKPPHNKKLSLADGVNAGCQKCIAEQESGEKNRNARHKRTCPLSTQSRAAAAAAATTNNNNNNNSSKKKEQKKKRPSGTDLTKQASLPKKVRSDNEQHANKQNSSISDAVRKTGGMPNDSTVSNNEGETYTAPTNNIVSIQDNVRNTVQALGEERHPTIKEFHDNKTVQYNNEAQRVVNTVTSAIFPTIDKVVSEQKVEHLDQLDRDQQVLVSTVSKTTCPITRDGLNKLVSDIELEKKRVSNEYDLHLHNEKERLETTIKGEVLLQETWRPDWSHCISVGLGLALAVVVRR